MLPQHASRLAVGFALTVMKMEAHVTSGRQNVETQRWFVQGQIPVWQKTGSDLKTTQGALAKQLILPMYKTGNAARSFVIRPLYRQGHYNKLSEANRPAIYTRSDQHYRYLAPPLADGQRLSATTQEHIQN